MEMPEIRAPIRSPDKNNVKFERLCYCIESEGVAEASGVRIPAHDPK